MYLFIVFVGNVFFIGEHVIGSNVLKKAARGIPVHVPTQQGIMEINALMKVKDLHIDLSKHPHAEFDNSYPMYREYIKLTTGIEVQTNIGETH